ncbi:MAG: hypothetical protein WKG01_00375 [Kofleriaceae bacterium]
MADHEVPEWKLRAAAIPGLVLVALAFHAWELGHFMQRTALSMPLHEVGHAATGWWCGFDAIPTLWKTLIPETRGVIMMLVIAAGCGWLVYRGWRTQQLWLGGVGLALGALQFLGTTASLETAQVLITFGGDAGAMVLGTVLMMTFFVGPDSRLRHGGLRWGLAGIGAAGFVDTFATWWSARSDTDVIPFGEIEGVGLSDPSKLQEVHGWSTLQLVDRYVLVGVVCLIALTTVYVWAVRDARRSVITR